MLHNRCNKWIVYLTQPTYKKVFGYSFINKEAPYDRLYEEAIIKSGKSGAPVNAHTINYRAHQWLNLWANRFVITILALVKYEKLKYYAVQVPSKPQPPLEYLIFSIRAHPASTALAAEVHDALEFEKNARVTATFSEYLEQAGFFIDMLSFAFKHAPTSKAKYANEFYSTYSYDFFYNNLRALKEDDVIHFINFLKKVRKFKEEEAAKLKKQKQMRADAEKRNKKGKRVYDDNEYDASPIDYTLHSSYVYNMKMAMQSSDSSINHRNNIYILYPLTAETIIKRATKSLFLFESIETIKFAAFVFLQKYNKKIKNSRKVRGLYTAYKFLKKVLLPLLVPALFIACCFVLFRLQMLRTGSGWVAFGLFVFWLLSGFNHFVKRNRFGKYTSANQRFWKRAFMCFWVIEGFLFTIFLYYALNASSEPLFMYDQSGLYTAQLQVINEFIASTAFVVLAILLLVHIIITIKFSTFRQTSVYLLALTCILVYFLVVESYQFYYLVNFYDDTQWVYSEEEQLWELEYEIPRSRNRNHYMTLIILAKFWHYIFIFASWVFFLMKCLELNKVRYAILSMNLQNLIIFYIMNWVCLYAWLKWFLRRFLDQQFYWFFTAFRPVTINSVLGDVAALSTHVPQITLSDLSANRLVLETETYFPGASLINTVLVLAN